MDEANLEAFALPELATFALASRQDSDVPRRAELALGIALPEPGRTLVAAGVRAVCTSPGQWLMLREGTSESLGALLAEALGEAASLIDVSGAHVGVRVRGVGARAALGRFLPLDLHPRTMRPGQAAATLAAHLPVLLWQVDDRPAYDLLCARSLAGSFRRALELISVNVAAAPVLS